uniref:Uncharacterized protein n=1 Tax=Craspedostauros australis TaxID=1486917 RepID=A0A7R9WTA2_9STRA|mmetsp:Transcript_16924/g.46821  ORF Transcript_16924/g.46821 Transcript_16924/m.46821 type:complete len:137 (+) Transcript_16924:381-791(+)
MNRAAGLLTEAEVIKVEHIYKFQIDEKWDQPIRKAVDSILHISWQWAQSSTIVAYGIAGFLVLFGTSKLITSIRGGGNSSSSSSRKSSSSSSSGSNNNSGGTSSGSSHKSSKKSSGSSSGSSSSTKSTKSSSSSSK